MGSFTPTPSTEWVSRSKAGVASRIVRAVILLHPRFGHSYVRHHVQIVFLGIEEKLGAVTSAILGAIVCQWDAVGVFEPGLLRLNENFVKVAGSCAKEGEGEVFVRDGRGDRGDGVPESQGWFCCYRMFSLKRAVDVQSTEFLVDRIMFCLDALASGAYELNTSGTFTVEASLDVSCEHRLN